MVRALRTKKAMLLPSAAHITETYRKLLQSARQNNRRHGHCICRYTLPIYTFFGLI